MPFTLEGRVIPSYAVPDDPVRECQLCAPYVIACAHFDGHTVRLVNRETSRVFHNRADCVVRPTSANPWRLVAGPDESFLDCLGCGLPSTDTYAIDARVLRLAYPTEAEAQAEFNRRVALMLGREEAS